MAISVLDADVEAIIEVDATIDLTPFITASTAVVQKHCADANPLYTDDDLNLITTWLAAHFYAIRDPRALVEDLGKISMTIESKVDLGLDVTRYGQMAKILDWYGGLAALDEQIKKGGRRVIGITWLGEESETLEE